MRIILSRKGFDSSSGGCPSPILPDGTMLSLPIPETAGPGAAPDYASVLAPNGMSYADIMRELNIPIPPSKPHLDPDLERSAVPRERGWRPAFGQSGAAEGHLEQQGVVPGDLFLFFGLFRKTRLVNGKLEWDPASKPQHVVFGYLEIGEVVRITGPQDAERYPAWKNHPHMVEFGRKKNTLYIAAKRRRLMGQQPGAGRFRFDERLVLSASGSQPSVWKLPKAFSTCAYQGGMSFHTDPGRWSVNPDGSFELKSVGRGQEFVMKSTSQLMRWASRLIEIGMKPRELEGPRGSLVA